MLRPDDFDRLVAAYRSDRAMGTAAGPVRDELVEVAKLAAALAEAREETCPCVIVAEVEPHHYLPDSTAWVDIEPAAVSGFTEVRAVREQYELDKAALQRLHY